MIVSVATLVVLVSAVGAVPTSPIQGRIVGGFDTTIEEHPYQVSIEVHNQHSCGGSIISNNYVLTAAHCFCTTIETCTPYVQKQDLNIRVGATWRQRGGASHSVDDYIKHPQYLPSSSDFDIGVIRVTQPFQFGGAVQRIPLIFEYPPAGSAVVATGWGNIDHLHTEQNPGTLAQHLQGLRMTIVGQRECSAVYQRLTDNMLCATSPEGKGVCSGDSGGPLVLDGKLVGITSWGADACAAGYPDVFTNVANLRDWVTQNTDVQ